MTDQLDLATRACIEANEECMKAHEKKMRILETLPKTPQTRKEYKAAFDAYHRFRIENLELKGELPKKEKKKRFRNGLYL